LHHEGDSEEFGLLNGFALVVLLLLQIGYDVSASSASAKILILVSSALTWLLFSYYTCDLTARMTSGPPKLSIRNFQHVMDQGCWRLS
jgi:hypothetical protein